MSKIENNWEQLFLRDSLERGTNQIQTLIRFQFAFDVERFLAELCEKAGGLRSGDVNSFCVGPSLINCICALRAGAELDAAEQLCIVARKVTVANFISLL